MILTHFWPNCSLYIFFFRNTLSNCGIRQPEYGDKRVHSASNRKRGINMLINIMSRFGKEAETESKVAHNERLEFLGKAFIYKMNNR